MKRHGCTPYRQFILYTNLRAENFRIRGDFLKGINKVSSYTDLLGYLGTVFQGWQSQGKFSKFFFEEFKVFQGGTQGAGKSRNEVRLSSALCGNAICLTASTAVQRHKCTTKYFYKNFFRCIFFRCFFLVSFVIFCDKFTFLQRCLNANNQNIASLTNCLNPIGRRLRRHENKIYRPRRA